MKQIKFSKQTGTISLIFFTIYFIYGIFHIPYVQYLVSIATGGIAYGIFNSYEAAIVALLIMNMVYPLLGPSPIKHEGFMGTNPMDISDRIVQVNKNGGIRGVGSQMTEGFEDATEVDLTLNMDKTSSENTEDVTATSKPAEIPQKKEKQEKEDKEDKEDKSTDTGLFKLGQIPTDAKGGFHIDAGTTVINALNALKPDQINAMTKDTKQLIETQKALMGMLQSFAPMVNEGKQMMDTFGTMFSPTMGANLGQAGQAGADVSGQFNLTDLLKPSA